jgi:biotin transporter BioY
MTNENNLVDHHVDLQASASPKGLSLKVKGAGLFVLIAITVCGIIFLGYQVSLKDSDSRSLIAIVFLMFIAQTLVAALLAILGLSKVRSK